jgi:SAM-dependent methyltransferase
VPTIDENYSAWSSYAWSDAGDEWSTEWGGSKYLWFGTIFPRVQAALPAETILEIAPGYGRCTQYLIPLCRNLMLVDLVEECIKTCKKRFEKVSHIQYFVNDGKSLDMIPDNAVDFVFSWDSLVHAENDVLLSYLQYLSKKLKKGGIGFMHHSNLGCFADPENGELTVENPHWRASTMTAELFRGYCNEVGLQCIAQEIIAWGGSVLHDCFSLFVRGIAETNVKTVIYENMHFMDEAHNLRRISEIYNPVSLRRNTRFSKGI